MCVFVRAYMCLWVPSYVFSYTWDYFPSVKSCDVCMHVCARERKMPKPWPSVVKHFFLKSYTSHTVSKANSPHAACTCTCMYMYINMAH